LRPALLDSSAIVALLDRREKFHPACVQALESHPGPLVTCEAVIAESCYLLRKIPGAAETVLENVIGGGFLIPFQLSRAAPEIVRIFRRYRDRQVDFADACLVHLAGEVRTGDILTLDRDFEVYRWGANKPFRLLVLQA
jgi:uncharacterized protein